MSIMKCLEGFEEYKIKTAGYVFDVATRFPLAKKLCEKFIVDDDVPADCEIIVTEKILEDMLDVARKECEEHGLPVLTGDDAIEYYEFLTLHKLISDWLPEHGAVMLHCSSVSAYGNAYLFTAPSGTGKSTHASLWKKLLGNRMTYINDDKPFIKKVTKRCESEGTSGDDTAYDFKLYACGSPWCGKHFRGENISAPIKAIGIICRDKKNFTKRIDPVEAFITLYKQMYLPREDEAQMRATIDMMKNLAECIPMYEIHCNMDIEAAQVAFHDLSES